MFPAEAKAATATALLNSANAANTAQATGGWVDIRGFVGDLVVIQNVGAITGNIAGALKASTAANGRTMLPCHSTMVITSLSCQPPTTSRSRPSM